MVVVCTVSGLAADWFCLLWSCFDEMNTDYLNRDVEQTVTVDQISLLFVIISGH